MPADGCSYYESLYKISRALHRQPPSVESALQTTLSLSAEALGVEHGCILTFSSQEVRDAFLLSGKISGEAEREFWSRQVSQGLVGYVQHSQRTVLIRNIQTDTRWPRLVSDGIPETGAAIGVPLLTGDHLLGVLMLLHPEIDGFDDEAVKLLEEAASLAADVYSNALVYEAASGGERYRSLYEELVVPIVITDLRGEIIDANRKACSFLGYEREALLGKPITTINRMGPEALSAERLRTTDAGQEVEFLTTARTAQGDSISVNVRARRLRLGSEDWIEWVQQDMRGQTQAEELHRDMVAMIYHDLRGPLHNINGSLSKLERLLSEGNAKPVVLELIRLGAQSSRQMTRMVRSLLDIERLEGGRAMINCDPTPLRALLSEAVETTRPAAAELGQKLTAEIADDLPVLWVDSDMMLRVFMNLIENAIKYTPSGGRIALTSKVVSDGVQISISDTGPGVPKPLQAQIFDKYFRVKNGRKADGLGLGLAFCRLAVEAHSGRIWVESEPESGSVFHVLLPAEALSNQARV